MAVGRKVYWPVLGAEQTEGDDLDVRQSFLLRKERLIMSNG
jgi:hypothetical protein